MKITELSIEEIKSVPLDEVPNLTGFDELQDNAEHKAKFQALTGPQFERLQQQQFEAMPPRLWGWMQQHHFEGIKHIGWSSPEKFAEVNADFMPRIRYTDPDNQLAELTPDHFTKMKPAQAGGFTGELVGAASVLQVLGWTTDHTSHLSDAATAALTIGRDGHLQNLQKKHFDGFVGRHIGALGLKVRELTVPTADHPEIPNQISWLTDEHWDGFTLGGAEVNQMGELSFDQAAKIPSERLGNFSAQKFSAYATVARIERLTREDVKALKPRHISILSTVVDGDGKSALNSLPFFEELSTESLAAITVSTTPPAAAGADPVEVNQAANLTAEQIGKIPPQKFGAGLSRQFVMDLTVGGANDQFGALISTPEGAAALTGDGIDPVTGAPILGHISGLNGEKILALIKSGGIQDILPENIQYFDLDNRNLGPNSTAIRASFLESLTSEQQMRLTWQQLSRYPVAEAQAEFTKLSREVRSAYNLDQLGLRAADYRAGYGPIAGLASITTPAALGNSENLTPIIVGPPLALGNFRINDFGVAHAQLLTPQDMNNLSPALYGQFKKRHIANMDQAIVSAIPPEKMSNLSDEAVQGFTTLHIQGRPAGIQPGIQPALRPEHFSHCRGSHFAKGFTDDQTKAFTGNLLNGIADANLRHLRVSVMKGDQLFDDKAKVRLFNKDEVKKMGVGPVVEKLRVYATTNEGAKQDVDRWFEALFANQESHHTPMVIRSKPELFNKLREEDLSSYNIIQTCIIPPENLAALDKKIKCFRGDQWGLFNDVQLGGVTASQTADLREEAVRKINPAYIWALKYSNNFKPEYFEWMDKKQFDGLSESQFRRFGKDHLQKIFELGFDRVKPGQMASFDPALFTEKNGFTRSMVQAITLDQCQELAGPQLQNMDERLFKAFTTGKNGTPNQFGRLPLHRLSPGQMHWITNEQWEAVTPEQFRKLGKDHLQELGRRRKKLEPGREELEPPHEKLERLQEIRFAAARVAALDEETQLPHLIPDVIAVIPDMTALRNIQIQKGFTDAHMPRLRLHDFSVPTSAEPTKRNQIAAIADKKIVHLDPSQIAHEKFDENFIRAFSSTQFQSFPDRLMGALRIPGHPPGNTVNHIAALDPERHVRYITGSHARNGLSPEHIENFTAIQVPELQEDFFANLNVAKLRAFLNAQNGALMNAMTGKQVGAVRGEVLAALEPEERRAFFEMVVRRGLAASIKSEQLGIFSDALLEEIPNALKIQLKAPQISTLNTGKREAFFRSLDDPRTPEKLEEILTPLINVVTTQKRALDAQYDALPLRANPAAGYLATVVTPGVHAAFVTGAPGLPAAAAGVSPTLQEAANELLIAPRDEIPAIAQRINHELTRVGAGNEVPALLRAFRGHLQFLNGMGAAANVNPNLTNAVAAVQTAKNALIQAQGGIGPTAIRGRGANAIAAYNLELPQRQAINPADFGIFINRFLSNAIRGQQSDTKTFLPSQISGCDATELGNVIVMEMVSAAVEAAARGAAADVRINANAGDIARIIADTNAAVASVIKEYASLGQPLTPNMIARAAAAGIAAIAALHAEATSVAGPARTQRNAPGDFVQEGMNAINDVLVNGTALNTAATNAANTCDPAARVAAGACQPAATAALGPITLADKLTPDQVEAIKGKVFAALPNAYRNELVLRYRESITPDQLSCCSKEQLADMPLAARRVFTELQLSKLDDKQKEGVLVGLELAQPKDLANYSAAEFERLPQATVNAAHVPHQYATTAAPGTHLSKAQFQLIPPENLWDYVDNAGQYINQDDAKLITPAQFGSQTSANLNNFINANPGAPGVNNLYARTITSKHLGDIPPNVLAGLGGATIAALFSNTSGANRPRLDAAGNIAAGALWENAEELAKAITSHHLIAMQEADALDAGNRIASIPDGIKLLLNATQVEGVDLDNLYRNHNNPPRRDAQGEVVTRQGIEGMAVATLHPINPADFIAPQTQFIPSRSINRYINAQAALPASFVGAVTTDQAKELDGGAILLMAGQAGSVTKDHVAAFRPSELVNVNSVQSLFGNATPDAFERAKGLTSEHLNAMFNAGTLQNIHQNIRARLTAKQLENCPETVVVNAYQGATFGLAPLLLINTPDHIVNTTKGIGPGVTWNMDPRRLTTALIQSVAPHALINWFRGGNFVANATQGNVRDLTLEQMRGTDAATLIQLQGITPLGRVQGDLVRDFTKEQVGEIPISAVKELLETNAATFACIADRLAANQLGAMTVQELARIPVLYRQGYTEEQLSLLDKTQRLAVFNPPAAAAVLAAREATAPETVIDAIAAAVINHPGNDHTAGFIAVINAIPDIQPEVAEAAIRAAGGIAGGPAAVTTGVALNVAINPSAGRGGVTHLQIHGVGGQRHSLTMLHLQGLSVTPTNTWAKITNGKIVGLAAGVVPFISREQIENSTVNPTGVAGGSPNATDDQLGELIRNFAAAITPQQMKWIPASKLAQLPVADSTHLLTAVSTHNGLTQIHNASDEQLGQLSGAQLDHYIAAGHQIPAERTGAISLDALRSNALSTASIRRIIANGRRYIDASQLKAIMENPNVVGAPNLNNVISQADKSAFTHEQVSLLTSGTGNSELSRIYNGARTGNQALLELRSPAQIAGLSDTNYRAINFDHLCVSQAQAIPVDKLQARWDDVLHNRGHIVEKLSGKQLNTLTPTELDQLVSAHGGQLNADAVSKIEVNKLLGLGDRALDQLLNSPLAAELPDEFYKRLTAQAINAYRANDGVTARNFDNVPSKKLALISETAIAGIDNDTITAILNRYQAIVAADANDPHAFPRKQMFALTTTQLDHYIDPTGVDGRDNIPDKKYGELNPSAVGDMLGANIQAIFGSTNVGNAAEDAHANGRTEALSAATVKAIYEGRHGGVGNFVSNMPAPGTSIKRKFGLNQLGLLSSPPDAPLPAAPSQLTVFFATNFADNRVPPALGGINLATCGPIKFAKLDYGHLGENQMKKMATGRDGDGTVNQFDWVPLDKMQTVKVQDLDEPGLLEAFSTDHTEKLSPQQIPFTPVARMSREQVAKTPRANLQGLRHPTAENPSLPNQVAELPHIGALDDQSLEPVASIRNLQDEQVPFLSKKQIKEDISARQWGLFSGSQMAKLTCSQDITAGAPVRAHYPQVDQFGSIPDVMFKFIGEEGIGGIRREQWHSIPQPLAREVRREQIGWVQPPDLLHFPIEVMSEEQGKGLTRPQLLEMATTANTHPYDTPVVAGGNSRLHALSNDAKKVITYQLVKEILAEVRRNPGTILPDAAVNGRAAELFPTAVLTGVPGVGGIPHLPTHVTNVAAINARLMTVANFSVAHGQAMRPNQIRNLGAPVDADPGRTDRLPDIILAAFDEDQFQAVNAQHLTVRQVTNLPKEKSKQFTPAQIRNLSAVADASGKSPLTSLQHLDEFDGPQISAYFENLRANPTIDIPTNQLHMLTQAHFDAMTDADVQYLFARNATTGVTPANHLQPAQWGYFKPDHARREDTQGMLPFWRGTTVVTLIDLAAIRTPEQMQNLRSEVIERVTDLSRAPGSALRAMKKPQVESINPKVFSVDIAGVRAPVMAPERFAAFSKEQFGWFTAAHMKHVTVEQLRNVSKEKLRQINKEAFQAIDPAVLSQLTPEERLRFSPTQFSWMTEAQTKVVLDRNTAPKLTAPHCRSIRSHQFPWIETEAFGKFKPEQVRDFDPGEMGGIQPPQFKTWTGRHTAEITTEQTPWISQFCIAAATDDALSGFPPASWGKFNKAMLSAVPVGFIPKMSDDVLRALQPGNEDMKHSDQVKRDDPENQMSALRDAHLLRFTPHQIAVIGEDEDRRGQFAALTEIQQARFIGRTSELDPTVVASMPQKKLQDDLYHNGGPPLGAQAGDLLAWADKHLGTGATKSGREQAMAIWGKETIDVALDAAAYQQSVQKSFGSKVWNILGEGMGHGPVEWIAWGVLWTATDKWFMSTVGSPEGQHPYDPFSYLSNTERSSYLMGPWIGLGYYTTFNTLGKIFRAAWRSAPLTPVDPHRAFPDLPLRDYMEGKNDPRYIDMNRIQEQRRKDLEGFQEASDFGSPVFTTLMAFTFALGFMQHKFYKAYYPESLKFHHLQDSENKFVHFLGQALELGATELGAFIPGILAFSSLQTLMLNQGVEGVPAWTFDAEKENPGSWQRMTDHLRDLTYAPHVHPFTGKVVEAKTWTEKVWNHLYDAGGWMASASGSTALGFGFANKWFNDRIWADSEKIELASATTDEARQAIRDRYAKHQILKDGVPVPVPLGEDIPNLKSRWEQGVDWLLQTWLDGELSFAESANVAKGKYTAQYRMPYDGTMQKALGTVTPMIDTLFPNALQATQDWGKDEYGRVNGTQNQILHALGDQLSRAEGNKRTFDLYGRNVMSAMCRRMGIPWDGRLPTDKRFREMSYLEELGTIVSYGAQLYEAVYRFKENIIAVPFHAMADTAALGRKAAVAGLEKYQNYQRGGAPVDLGDDPDMSFFNDDTAEHEETDARIPHTYISQKTRRHVANQGLGLSYIFKDPDEVSPGNGNGASNGGELNDGDNQSFSSLLLNSYSLTPGTPEEKQRMEMLERFRNQLRDRGDAELINGEWRLTAHSSFSEETLAPVFAIFNKSERQRELSNEFDQELAKRGLVKKNRNGSYDIIDVKNLAKIAALREAFMEYKNGPVLERPKTIAEWAAEREIAQLTTSLSEKAAAKGIDVDFRLLQKQAERGHAIEKITAILLKRAKHTGEGINISEIQKQASLHLDSRQPVDGVHQANHPVDLALARYLRDSEQVVLDGHGAIEFEFDAKGYPVAAKARNLTGQKGMDAFTAGPKVEPSTDDLSAVEEGKVTKNVLIEHMKARAISEFLKNQGVERKGYPIAEVADYAEPEIAGISAQFATQVQRHQKFEQQAKELESQWNDALKDHPLQASFGEKIGEMLRMGTPEEKRAAEQAEKAKKAGQLTQELLEEHLSAIGGEEQKIEDERTRQRAEGRELAAKVNPSKTNASEQALFPLADRIIPPKEYVKLMEQRLKSVGFEEVSFDVREATTKNEYGKDINFLELATWVNNPDPKGTPAVIEFARPLTPQEAVQMTRRDEATQDAVCAQGIQDFLFAHDDIRRQVVNQLQKNQKTWINEQPADQAYHYILLSKEWSETQKALPVSPLVQPPTYRQYMELHQAYTNATKEFKQKEFTKILERFSVAAYVDNGIRKNCQTFVAAYADIANPKEEARAMLREEREEANPDLLLLHAYTDRAREMDKQFNEELFQTMKEELFRTRKKEDSDRSLTEVVASYLPEADRTQPKNVSELASSWADFLDAEATKTQGSLTTQPTVTTISDSSGEDVKVAVRMANARLEIYEEVDIDISAAENVLAFEKRMESLRFSNLDAADCENAQALVKTSIPQIRDSEEELEERMNTLEKMRDTFAGKTRGESTALLARLDRELTTLKEQHKSTTRSLEITSRFEAHLSSLIPTVIGQTAYLKEAFQEEVEKARETLGKLPNGERTRTLRDELNGYLGFVEGTQEVLAKRPSLSVLGHIEDEYLKKMRNAQKLFAEAENVLDEAFVEVDLGPSHKEPQQDRGLSGINVGKGHVAITIDSVVDHETQQEETRARGSDLFSDMEKGLVPRKLQPQVQAKPTTEEKKQREWFVVTDLDLNPTEQAKLKQFNDRWDKEVRPKEEAAKNATITKAQSLQVEVAKLKQQITGEAELWMREVRQAHQQASSTHVVKPVSDLQAKVPQNTQHRAEAHEQRQQLRKDHVVYKQNGGTLAMAEYSRVKNFLETKNSQRAANRQPELDMSVDQLAKEVEVQKSPKKPMNIQQVEAAFEKLVNSQQNSRSSIDSVDSLSPSLSPTLVDKPPSKLGDVTQEELKNMVLNLANAYLASSGNTASSKSVAAVQKLSDEGETKEILLLQEDGDKALVLINDPSKNDKTATGVVVEKDRLPANLSNNKFTTVTILPKQHHNLGQDPTLIPQEARRGIK